MRKILFAVLAFFIVAAGWAQTAPKIAVLNPTLDASIDVSIGGAVIDKVTEELLASRKFNILDRNARDQIWEERNFQISSGEIKNDEIKQVGRGLGADYVVAAKVRKVGTLYSMTATMINVESLEVVAQASSESEASVEALLQLASYCGKLLAQRTSIASNGSAVTIGADTGDAISVEPPTRPATGAAGAVSVASDTVAVASGGTDARTEVRPLLKQRLFLKVQGQKRINDMLGSMEISERKALYREFKKDGALVDALLNLVPVVPVGSLVQGDISGAIWLFVIQAGSLGLGEFFASRNGELDLSAKIATGVFTVAYVYGWFQPFVFEKKWNTGLSKSVGVVAAIGAQDLDIRLAKAADGGIDGTLGVTLVSLSW